MHSPVFVYCGKNFLNLFSFRKVFFDEGIMASQTGSFVVELQVAWCIYTWFTVSAGARLARECCCRECPL